MLDDFCHLGLLQYGIALKTTKNPQKFCDVVELYESSKNSANLSVPQAVLESK